jgi:hypothetical protein
MILVCGAAVKAASGASARTIVLGALALGGSMIGLYQAASWMLTG